VEGLFLSSGVWRSATDTVEKMIDALSLLRNKYRFQGYIHVKILPGTSKDHIRQIMEIADRVSLNVELPSSSRLSEVSSMKNYDTDIIKCQKYIHQFIEEGLVPAGQTTQFIVGTTGESDQEIIERLHWEYRNLDLRRSYFSAFTPIKGTPLESKTIPETYQRKRENFLYRVDWLFRRYQYRIESIYSIMDDKGMIPLNVDPKVSLALKDDIFPVDINEASYNELLRVPGIGEVSSRRIINLRKINKKIESYRDLQRLGVVIKRAKSFITVKGQRQTSLKEFVN
jgi:predicted DNA-binding helix-hairpin-helix protein